MSIVTRRQCFRPYKTTTAVNLSVSLAKKNKKVLLVDIDPQGNATSGIGVDKREINKSTYDVIIGDLPIKDAIIKTKIDKLYICPSNIQLAGAEVELVSMVSRETRLKNCLAELDSI